MGGDVGKTRVRRHKEVVERGCSRTVDVAASVVSIAGVLELDESKTCTLEESTLLLER